MNEKETPSAVGEGTTTSARPSPNPSPPASQFLHYGDIIQLFTSAVESSKTLDLNERTFLVDYIDDDKIRLVDTTRFDTFLLHIDDEGHLTEPSIRRVELLTRAKEPGYARQKGLFPDQWVDIFFLGVDTPLTGKITHLEEDQIELTLHPSQEIIYIDFSYRGLPEDLNIEKFVLRSAPPSSSAVRTEAAEDAEQEPLASASATPSMEYTPDNEIVLFIPENVEYDANVNEVLREQYLEADELFFGKDRHVVEQFVEQEQYEMVFNIDTQLTSLMNELLSQIPNAQRTHDVMLSVHRLLDRFRELREEFSVVDPYTHQIQNVWHRGPYYKPLLEYLISPEAAPLSWLLPVTQTRRNMYFMPDEYATDFTEMGDTVMLPYDVELLQDIQEDYTNDAMHGVVNPYRHWLSSIDGRFHPMDATSITSSYTSGETVPRKSLLFAPIVANDRWESVVDNTVNGEEFTASAVAALAKHTELHSVPFFLQRFNAATTYMERSPDNRRVFHPELMGKGETMAIQSWLTMPISVVHFSRVHLPSLDMARRSQWSQDYWLKYRTLPTSQRRGRATAAAALNTFVVDDWDADYFYTLRPRGRRGPETDRGLLTKNFMSGLQHFVLDPALADTPSQEHYRSFLRTMIPSTFDLVELVQSQWTLFHGLGVRDFLDHMEPFHVHWNSLPYTAYNRIRYFIKKRTQAYKEAFYSRKDAYRKLAYTYEKLVSPSHVTQMMDNNLARRLLQQGALYEIFMEAYRAFHIHTDRPWVPTSSSELLQDMIRKDASALFFLLMRNASLHHVVAESFLKAVEPAEDDVDGDGEVSRVPLSKHSKCSRFFLVKRYTSLGDLQKDNYQDDVYYDKDFDDTPYTLLNAYKSEMPAATGDANSPAMREFLDLLTVSLVQKHGVDAAAAAELARTLVSKKKRVSEGEYALLDIYPETAEGETLSIPNREFFKRIKNKWVRDTSIQEESFANLAYLIQTAFPTRSKSHAPAVRQINPALCNQQPDCFKNATTATCDSSETVEQRIQKMRQQYAVQEMESRLNLSQEELAKQMEIWVLQASRVLVAKERLRTVLEQKHSLLAHHMGICGAKAMATVAGDTEPVVASPYVQLRNDILGQDDFAKRQHDIVRFYQTGVLRRAMKDELGEDTHWLYCIQTNTKLMPAFLYDLAMEFVLRGEAGYQARLEEYTQFQMLSDDGDAIIDKHSGYVLTKIEWANEDLYDEHGFRIQTARALVIPPEESDASPNPWDAPSRDEALASGAADTEVHVTVKNIFATFCQAMDLTPKEYETTGFRSFVVRTTMELFEVLVKPQDEFVRDLSLRNPESEAKMAAKYKTYWHQYVIVLTMAVFLIGIQTTLPPIRPKKTVPGCVKSFTGFPLTETTEDQTGIAYLVCILQLVKSSVPPWNSIKNIKKEAIQEMLKKTLERILESRKEVYELYQRQRTYREEHPDEFVIPQQYQLQTWVHLLPPVVDIGIRDRLPRERPPYTPSRAIRYAYGVIECIHQVVRKKEMLMKTALGVPFIQNACCNESTTGETTLQYFMRESPELALFLRHLSDYQGRAGEAARSRAATLVFTDDTRQKTTEVVSGPAEELIYAAFIHFCHFDRADVDIPAHLKSVCASKPAAEKYAAQGTLAEKIQSLKHMGKKYSWEEFEELVRRVNRTRRVTSDVQFTPPTAVKVLTEFLAVGDATPAPSRLDVIRAPLLQVLVKYDPQIMLLEHSDTAPAPDSMYAALDDLVNVLGPYNEAARRRIEASLPRGTGRDFASRILSSWTLGAGGAAATADALYTHVAFLKNTIVFLVKVLPPMVFHDQFYKEWRIPKHWDMGAKHQEVIVTFLNKNREWFAKFAKSDQAFVHLFRDWQASLMDIVRLVQLLPIQQPIVKGDRTYFRLFSTTAMQELLKYIGYAVFDQWVLLAQGLPKTPAGTKTRQTVVQCMVAMMEMLHSDKKTVDMSYADIMREVEKSRTKEKARIMRTFQEANETDRRYMYMEKVFKLNRWSVRAKDLLKENNTQFEKEVAEFVDDTVDERFGDDGTFYDVDPRDEGGEVRDEDAHDDMVDDNEGDEEEYDEEDRAWYDYDNEDA